MANESPNKILIKKWGLFSLCFLAVLSIACHLWGFQIYTFCWHLLYSDQITWEKYKINIPHDLIAREIKNNEGFREIQIYSLKNPSQIDVLFERVDYHLKNNFDFERKYQAGGFKIVEQNKYEILGKKCTWIKSIKKSNSKIYKEDIFFLEENTLISFIGLKEKNYYLIEIVNNLQTIE
jgi:hypothetical protein